VTITITAERTENGERTTEPILGDFCLLCFAPRGKAFPIDAEHGILRLCVPRCSTDTGESILHMGSDARHAFSLRATARAAASSWATVR
jgi:hypothetical protein